MIPTRGRPDHRARTACTASWIWSYSSRHGVTVGRSLRERLLDGTRATDVVRQSMLRERPSCLPSCTKCTATAPTTPRNSTAAPTARTATSEDGNSPPSAPASSRTRCSLPGQAVEGAGDEGLFAAGVRPGGGEVAAAEQDRVLVLQDEAAAEQPAEPPLPLAQVVHEQEQLGVGSERIGPAAASRPPAGARRLHRVGALQGHAGRTGRPSRRPTPSGSACRPSRARRSRRPTRPGSPAWRPAPRRRRPGRASPGPGPSGSAGRCAAAAASRGIARGTRRSPAPSPGRRPRARVGQLTCSTRRATDRSRWQAAAASRASWSVSVAAKGSSTIMPLTGQYGQRSRTSRRHRCSKRAPSSSTSAALRTIGRPDAVLPHEQADLPLLLGGLLAPLALVRGPRFAAISCTAPAPGRAVASCRWSSCPRSGRRRASASPSTGQSARRARPSSDAPSQVTYTASRVAKTCSGASARGGLPNVHRQFGRLEQRLHRPLGSADDQKQRHFARVDPARASACMASSHASVMSGNSV